MEDRTTTKSRESLTRSHRINVDTGVKACAATGSRTKSLTDISISWKINDEDGVKFAVVCLQVFSNKSPALILAEAMQFYPLHVTFQNFTETAHSQHVSNGSYGIAYLQSVAALSLKRMATYISRKALANTINSGNY